MTIDSWAGLSKYRWGVHNFYSLSRDIKYNKLLIGYGFISKSESHLLFLSLLSLMFTIWQDVFSLLRDDMHNVLGLVWSLIEIFPSVSSEA